MKILLRKILEKLFLVVLFFIIIVGNFLLIYNLTNKFEKINEIYDVSNEINNSSYIYIKDILNNNIIEVNTQDKKEDLKQIFNKVKIRESKLELMDKEQKFDYSILIYSSLNGETIINITDLELMIKNKIYEIDMSINESLAGMFK